MTPFGYQIVVQWDTRSSSYEAYSPTLSMFAAKFAPALPKTAYGDSMSSAVHKATEQAKDLLAELRRLAILPPPSDTGDTDLTDCYRNYAEKMVL